MSRFMNPYFAPLPITAIGLATGLLVAGSLVQGNALYFFTEDYFTLVTGVFFGIVGFLLFDTRGRLLQAQTDLAKSQTARAQQEKLLTETELKLLQAQIEPHFLFNTLSNIASLIQKDPSTAEQTLLNLTTLLRATLDRTRRSNTTLGQEMEIAQAYLEIQATRMQGRLSYDIKIDPGLETMLLPPLIVQPLIENAVKHGIEPQETGGMINLSVRAHGDGVEIEIVDNGVGISATGCGEDRTGIPNVRARLKALYEGASLTLSEPSNGGVRVLLRLPSMPAPADPSTNL